MDQIEKISNDPLPVYRYGLLKFIIFPVLDYDADAEPDAPCRVPYKVFKDDGLFPTMEEVDSIAPIVEFLLQRTQGEA
jgi:hypothetical protein